MGQVTYPLGTEQAGVMNEVVRKLNHEVLGLYRLIRWGQETRQRYGPQRMADPGCTLVVEFPLPYEKHATRAGR